MNSWDFEQDEGRIRLSQRPTRKRPALIVETPTHRATLEFATLLDLHEFQSAFEHHLLTSGWTFVGFSRRRMDATEGAPHADERHDQFPEEASARHGKRRAMRALS